MDPMTASALIGVGGRLLGGLFGRKDEKKAAETALYQHRMRFKWTRKDAERAGFNPLTALGTGSISAPAVPAGSAMGAAISDAAMLAADLPWQQQQVKLERDRLQVERDKLQQKLTQATIRPKTGGLYAEPTVMKRLGRGGANDASVNGVDQSDPARLPSQRGPFDMWRVLPGQVKGPRISYDLDESVRRQHMGPVNQSFTRSDGTIIEVPVGMDFDEMLMGQVMDKGPDLYDRAKDNWQRSPFLMGPRLITEAGGKVIGGFQAVNAWAKGDKKIPSSKRAYEKRREEWLSRPAMTDLRNNPYLNLKGY